MNLSDRQVKIETAKERGMYLLIKQFTMKILDMWFEVLEYRQ